MSSVHSFFDMGSCMDRLVGDNASMIASSLCAWQEVGGLGIWATTFVFGFFPLLIMLMLYVRTQKVGPTAFGGLISMMLVNGVELYYFNAFGTLVYPFMSGVAYIVLLLMLAVGLKTHATE